MRSKGQLLVGFLCIGILIGFGAVTAKANSDLASSIKARQAQVQAIRLQIIAEDLNEYEEWVDNTYREAYEDLGSEIYEQIGKAIGGSFSHVNSLRELTEGAMEWQGSVVEAWKSEQAKKIVRKDLVRKEHVFKYLIEVLRDEYYAARTGDMEELKEKIMREFHLIEIINGYAQGAHFASTVEFLDQLEGQIYDIESWCEETFFDINGRPLNEEEREKLRDWFNEGVELAN